MKQIYVRAGLVAVMLTLTSTLAHAIVRGNIFGDPNVLANTIVTVLQVMPDGTSTPIMTGTTDAHGHFNAPNLPSGDYEFVVDGPSLVATMDKLAPPPRKKSSGGLGFSVGGVFGGGGSSHSSSGHEGATNGHPDSGHGDSHSSGGGVGVGLSIPLGGDKSSDQPGYPITAINILLPSGQDLSTETPYCRDAAIHGMRIGFTVREGGGAPVAMSIKEIEIGAELAYKP